MRFIYQPDGGATYMTADGDFLDLIAFNFYGTHDDTTLLLYASNQDLALVDQPFEAGRTIILPARQTSSAPPAQIQLWD
jgi:phage tail protein X